MKKLISTVLLVLVAAGQHALAQVPFPPAAVTSAPSVQAAMAAIGAVQPINAGHLLLDLPEISPVGTVKGEASSLVPGTTLIYVFRSIPTAAKAVGKSAEKAPARRTAQSTSKPSAAALAPPPSPTVLVAAKQVGAHEPARLPLEFEFEAREFYTLAAFAQGKWFVTGREIKPATVLKPGSASAP